ncbi:MAG: hypothetical protein JF886_10970 [Candidatus Dormibacteraeota bacterium]|uniref:Uncharacterized protein n=1 Tax=Candidatus Aeolococcus gillhamiae TaxID=3127015 RepID=A0A934K1Y4_9BACT|nr:hypothetical protein [Candidatus Dormibacteraeota bacterium]
MVGTRVPDSTVYRAEVGASTAATDRRRRDPSLNTEDSAHGIEPAPTEVPSTIASSQFVTPAPAGIECLDHRTIPLIADGTTGSAVVNRWAEVAV